MNCKNLLSKTIEISTKSIVFVSFLATFSACDYQPGKGGNENPIFNFGDDDQSKSSNSSTNSSKVFFEKRGNGCSGNECPTLSVSYPKTNSSQTKGLENVVSRILSDYVTNSRSGQSKEKIAEIFVDNYAKFKKQFPSAKTAWYLNIDINVSLNTVNFSSYKLTLDTYAGGAHPIEETHYINIDSKGNEINKLGFFIKSKRKLENIAEAKFRKANNLNAKASLNEAGFTFSGDDFSLSENYGFTHKGMIIQYNHYEISDYSKGPTSLLLPFSEIAEIYKFTDL